MGKPVHILQVFATFCPGGPQVRFARLANAFGPDVSYTIVAMDGNFDAAKLLNPEIRVTLLPPATRRTPWSALAFRKLILKIRPDLTITNNWGSIDAVVGSWSAGVCPTIHGEDGFGPDESTALKHRRVLARRIILNAIRTTIVPSNTLLRIAKERYMLKGQKVTMIPNGIDVHRFRPERCPAIRTELGIAEDALVFGSIGHLRAEKALHVLISAFARADLHDARLVLVGDGSCRADLTNLAAQLGVADRVIFSGPTVHPERYLAAFDVFAMSSSTEQMPLSLLEAMGSGLPALCTDVGDCAEMLNTREPSVIVPSGDVDAYARALKTHAENTELRRRLGEVNRRRCVEDFSLERMTNSYASLYEGILEGRNISDIRPATQPAGKLH